MLDLGLNVLFKGKNLARLLGGLGVAMKISMTAVIISLPLGILLGVLMTTDTAEWFQSFSMVPYSVIPFHVIVVVGTLLTLFLGAHSIERTNKVMMPLFFMIFLFLAIRVSFLPGAAEGYRFSRAMRNPGFIGVEDIRSTYLPMGFSQFKIEGRGLGSALVLEFLLYYLTKPEHQLQVREEIYLDNMLDLF